MRHLPHYFYRRHSSFCRPLGVGAELEKGQTFLLIPQIWCLASLGKIQSSLCSLNVAFLRKNSQYLICFAHWASILSPWSACHSCCFFALRTTSHSARQTLWTPKAPNLSKSTRSPPSGVKKCILDGFQKEHKFTPLSRREGRKTGCFVGQPHPARLEPRELLPLSRRTEGDAGGVDRGGTVCITVTRACASPT